MCNGIPAFAIANFGEHGNLEFIPAFQMSIDMASTYCMQTPSVHVHVFMLIK